MDDYSFALRLKTIRERRGLMQRDLGERLEINPNRISNWELGYNFPTLDVFRKLCVALNCSANDLLGLSYRELNEDEFYCLTNYRRLDAAGQHTVRAVIDSQLQRLGLEPDA